MLLEDARGMLDRSVDFWMAASDQLGAVEPDLRVIAPFSDGAIVGAVPLEGKDGSHGSIFFVSLLAATVAASLMMLRNDAQPIRAHKEAVLCDDLTATIEVLLRSHALRPTAIEAGHCQEEIAGNE